MIELLLRQVLAQRMLVLAATVMLVLGGLAAARLLPIDAVPDITDKQVVVNASATGLAPEEIERLVTFPLEMGLTGVPRLRETRSISQFGLSQVTAVFDDDVDLYFARQQIAERLQSIRTELPPGAVAELGPVSTGLGELVHIRLDSPGVSLRERRALMDWVVRPQLLGVSGLAEVNAWGGTVRQFQVVLDARRMEALGIPLRAVTRALGDNNRNAGGAYVARGTQQALVRAVGMLTGLDDIRRVVVGTRSGLPVTIQDVGEVREGDAVRQGAVTEMGRGEEVYCLALLLIGENGRVVLEGVRAKIRAIEKSLPAGSHLVGFLDRSELIDRTLHTAVTNLVEGGVLVVVVLFLFLLEIRAGLIVSAVIPLAMLAAIIGMQRMGVSANLMSLGAIDFGLVVDGAVIIVENVVRRMALRHEAGGEITPAEREAVVMAATTEVMRPSLLGVLIIMVTYIPILTLGGVEGKMFRPMGTTVLLALGAALVLSLTVVPALCLTALKFGPEHLNPVLTWLETRYRPLLAWHLHRRRFTLGTALAFVVLALVVLPFLGSEFIPELDEGSVAVSCLYEPSTSLAEVIERSGLLERALLKRFPTEIARVVTRIGRPEVATDPMLSSQTDVLIALRPRAGWKAARDKEALVARMAELFESSPGLSATFTQPIKMRMMEMIEGQGMKSDLGIKVYGPELARLSELGGAIAKVVAAVPGAADAKLETTEGLPQLNIRIRREAIARHGLDVEDVAHMVETSLGGQTVTQVTDGSRRIDVSVRLAEHYRDDAEKIGRLLVGGATGPQVPLATVADVGYVDGPVQISRENGQRRIVVLANVRGRDLGSFTEEVKAKVDGTVKLPPGYWLEYGGTYERLQSGRARMALVLPITFLVVFLLLCATLGSIVQAVIVSTGIPFAVTGGVLALAVRGMPFSISAGVGFIALAGIAVLNGLVMVTFINQLRTAGLKGDASILDGAKARLRPVLMTATVASLGFVPMALSSGSGSEVQRPLATVVIGGLVTSTLLTLIVLPTLFGWLVTQPDDTMKVSEDA